MKVRPTTLAQVAHRPAPPRAGACRICLEPEVVIGTQFEVATGNGTATHMRYETNLDRGICKDREACETRQPPLLDLK